MRLGEIIRQYREKNDLSMDDFAKLSGISKGYISMLEKDRNPQTGNPITPSIDMYRNVAKAMNISIERLMNFATNTDVALIHDENNFKTSFDETTLSNYVPVAKKKIPLLGTIVAGQPIYADECFEEYLPIDETIHADYALRVKGDSMINAGINDGDIVYIKKQEDVDDGQIAVVIIDDEATLKRVYHMDGFLQLQAENPKYAPIICSQENCMSYYIIGLATAVLNIL